MRRQNTQDLVGPWYFAGFHERRRAEHAIAEETSYVRSVLIDRPEALDRDGGAVDVFPTRVDDSPVRHYRGSEVIQVVRRETNHVLAVGVAAIEDRRSRVPAVRERGLDVRQQRDPAVGQPAGVHVVGLALGDLRQTGPVGLYAEYVVGVQCGLTPTEQDLVSAVGYVTVEHFALGRIDDLFQSVGAFGKIHYVQPAAGLEAFCVIGVHVR